VSELAQPQVGYGNEVGRCAEPRAARLACCIRPFMASTKALLRWSSMPRATASKCVLSVAPRRLKESIRLRRAQEIQRLRSALASVVRQAPSDSDKRDHISIDVRTACLQPWGALSGGHERT